MKKYSKLITTILTLIIAFACLFAVGCKKENTNTNKDVLAFDKSSVTMYVFEIETLTLESKSDAQITWSCTDDSLIELIPEGKTVTLRGLRTGEVTIIAKQGNNSKSCKITIFPERQSLTVEVTSALTKELSVNGTYQLTAKALLDNELFEKATLEFRLTQDSPSGCVTIDNNGLVTAVSQGVAIVSVRAVFGNTCSDWEDVTLYVFADDYNNENQKDPTLNGGIIEDVFGDWQ